MSYTWIDGVVLFVLVVSTILAWSRGFTREAFSILGWVISAIVAIKFAHLVVPFIEDLPFIRDYISESCELLTVTAAVVLFIITMIVMALLTPLFSGFVQSSALSTIDSGLGAVFGFARGFLIVLLLVIVYDNFISQSTRMDFVEDARSYALFSSPKEQVEQALPTEDVAPSWISEQFENLTNHCRITDNV